MSEGFTMCSCIECYFGKSKMVSPSWVTMHPCDHAFAMQKLRWLWCSHCCVNFAILAITWDQAQFEWFSYILLPAGMLFSKRIQKRAWSQVISAKILTSSNSRKIIWCHVNISNGNIGLLWTINNNNKSNKMIVFDKI